MQAPFHVGVFGAAREVAALVRVIGAVVQLGLFVQPPHVRPLPVPGGDGLAHQGRTLVLEGRLQVVGEVRALHLRFLVDGEPALGEGELTVRRRQITQQRQEAAAEVAMGRGHAHEIEHSRQDVDHLHHRIALLAAFAEPGTADDQRVAGDAVVHRGRPLLDHPVVAEVFAVVGEEEVPGHAMSNPYAFGTLLYDLETDPEQQHPLVDDALELRMATLLTDLLRTSDAPREQYVRLGLPESGPVTEAHLLARAQRPQVEASTAPPPRPEDFPTGPLSVHTPLRDLLAHAEGERILRTHFTALLDGPFARMAGEMSLLQIAAFAVGLVPRDLLQAIAAELAAASAPELGTSLTSTANAVQP
ncbi:hypothetical protein ACIBK8_07905 [Streptomyces sp. NPDC050161]|uniref:hypothetical protein n=1 Tax=Streptomyces sp. NPDC050161 TaxID=3365604 RepID=UPI0037A99A0A